MADPDADATSDADAEADTGGRQIAPIVILAYDGVAGDEVSVLVDILSAAGLEVTIASVQAKPVTSYNGRVVPSRRAVDMGRCSAVLIPGGMGVAPTAANAAVMGAIVQLTRQSQWIGATSTGSVLLAAAGVIDGARVTTHWLAGDMITSRGLELVNEPFVEWGRLLTASGIVGTATMAFRLVGALLGTEAETKVRNQFVPPSSNRDRRYEQPPPWWRLLFDRINGPRSSGRRKRVVHDDALLSIMDRLGQADVVVLDLFDDEPNSTG